MESKNNNTAVIVIAFSVIIIVAMICGMIIWLMQRSMAMNERLNDRLLDVRLQEAKTRSAQAATPAIEPKADPVETAELVEMRQKLQAAEEAIKREAEARKKAESVRKLYRTSAEIPYAGGKYPPKPLHRILSGILTTRSGWGDPYADPFKKCIGAYTEQQQVDCGCILTEGSFFYDYESNVLRKSGKDESLVYFSCSC